MTNHAGIILLLLIATWGCRFRRPRSSSSNGSSTSSSLTPRRSTARRRSETRSPVGWRRRSGCIGAGKWCGKGIDLKENVCSNKLDKGQVCGTVGELGTGHRCKSGSCKLAGVSKNLTCQ
jgi:hypothetical protein